uniref:Uncharacterized protein n=1 Tax=Denticeps clupeoides TaxID=299321 RepID=A0AAY4AFH7_9TELE
MAGLPASERRAFALKINSYTSPRRPSRSTSILPECSSVRLASFLLPHTL